MPFTLVVYRVSASPRVIARFEYRSPPTVSAPVTVAEPKVLAPLTATLPNDPVPPAVIVLVESVLNEPEVPVYPPDALTRLRSIRVP